jgi:hypothetical protein
MYDIDSAKSFTEAPEMLTPGRNLALFKQFRYFFKKPFKATDRNNGSTPQKNIKFTNRQ